MNGSSPYAPADEEPLVSYKANMKLNYKAVLHTPLRADE